MLANMGMGFRFDVHLCFNILAENVSNDTTMAMVRRFGGRIGDGNG